MKKISLMIGICAVLIIGCAFTATLIAGRVFLAEPSARISELQAKKIALQDAGEDFEKVTFTRNTLQSENDRAMYRVEFYSDEMSYLYQIDGDTGSIYHREAQKTERTGSYGLTASSAAKSSDTTEAEASQAEENALKYIGVKRAQDIALKDAGLSQDQVNFEKAILDQEDGIFVYDIHFQAEGVEYEYEIKALDGYILEKEMEVEDQEFQRQKDSDSNSSQQQKGAAKQSPAKNDTVSGNSDNYGSNKSEHKKKSYDRDDDDDDHDDDDDDDHDDDDDDDDDDD